MKKESRINLIEENKTIAIDSMDKFFEMKSKMYSSLVVFLLLIISGFFYKIAFYIAPIIFCFTIGYYFIIKELEKNISYSSSKIVQNKKILELKGENQEEE